MRLNLTLISNNPRCSVLKPPIDSSKSFISSVIWIFCAARIFNFFVFSIQNLCFFLKRFFIFFPAYCSRDRVSHADLSVPSPVDSIRLAVFTVSPNRQYRGIFVPTIPATTGPVWAPQRICSVSSGLLTETILIKKQWNARIWCYAKKGLENLPSWNLKLAWCIH